jgi:hypothetical protein
LKQDFKHEDGLLEDLEDAKSKLHEYYETHYALRPDMQTSIPQSAPDTDITASSNRSPHKISFTARYREREQEYGDELEEYFKLRLEDFDQCHPPEWWHARKRQFPHLYCLARDILLIPGMLSSHWPFYLTSNLMFSLNIGSAVGVERLFSGGRDTISLRRASLKPETVRMLMLAKHRIRAGRYSGI